VDVCRGTKAPVVVQDNNRLVITVPLRRGVDLVSFVSEVVNALTGATGRGADGLRGGSTAIKVGFIPLTLMLTLTRIPTCTLADSNFHPNCNHKPHCNSRPETLTLTLTLNISTPCPHADPSPSTVASVDEGACSAMPTCCSPISVHARWLKQSPAPQWQVGKSSSDAGTAVLRFQPVGGHGAQPSDMEVCAVQDLINACRACTGNSVCTGQQPGAKR